MGKLIIDIRLGDVLKIGNAEVCLKMKSGKMSRLEITASQDTQILLERKSAPNSDSEHTHHGEHTL